MTVYGEGTQSRDFCFIDNTVEANLAAASAPAAAVSGGVFNLAGGAATTLNDVHGRARLLGYRGEISFGDGLKRSAAWYSSKR